MTQRRHVGVGQLLLLLLLCSAGRWCHTRADTLPSTLPTMGTTSIEFTSDSDTGTIPSQYGLLTAVTSIIIKSTYVSGFIPSQLGLLTLATQCQLQRNVLTSSVPSELGQLVALETHFRIDSNDLTSSVPSQLGHLSQLGGAFVLSGNAALNGTLPSQLGGLTSITTSFEARTCLLTGTVPTQLGRLVNLQELLQLQHNSFSSRLPSELGEITGFKTSFDAESNHLSFLLPSELGRWTALQSGFYLNDNSITGSLPTELGNLGACTSSAHIYSNNLCGDFPSELFALEEQLTDILWATGNQIGTPCCEVTPEVYTCAPTASPSISPMPSVTPVPTGVPFPAPSPAPSGVPSPAPTTGAPSAVPTAAPTPFCGRGEFLDGDSCEACEAGKFRNDTLPPAVCTLCEAGTYRDYSSDPSNALACYDCPAGRLSSTDRTSCIECSAGEYTLNETACVACAAGKYAPTAQADDCLECVAGSATGVASGATECSSCEAGTYSVAESVNCTTCPVGTYSTSRAEECSDCIPGYYSAVWGATSCTACAAGTAINASGATACVACALGTYQSATAQVSCEDCPAGHYADSNRSTSCTACPAGYYNDQPRSSACSACALGRYLFYTGQADCVDCIEGFYGPSKGASACLRCSTDFGPSYTSTQAASNCTQCIPGYFMDDNGECEPCPTEGVDCANVGTTLASLDLLAGYFRFAADSSSIYECPYSQHCLGGTEAGGDSCMDGSEGPLCSLCQSNHYFDAFTWRCDSCHLSSAHLVLPAAALVFVLLVTTITFVNRHVVHRCVVASLEKNQERLDDLLDGITLIFVTMQIIVIVHSQHLKLGGNTLQWPYVSFLKTFEWVGLDFIRSLPIGCVSQTSHLDAMLAWSLAPICVFAVGAYSVRNASSTNRTTNLSFFCQGLFLLLPTISTTICETFRCASFDHGSYTYLAVDYSVNCNTQSYSYTVAFAVFACLVYPIGVPLGLFVWLFKYVEHLDPATNDTEEQTIDLRKLDDKLKRCAVAPFAMRHRPGFWYYEIYNMVRRLALTSGSLVFTRSDNLLLYILAVAIITTVYEREAQARVNKFLGALSYVCCWQVVIVIIALFVADSDMTSGAGDVLIGGVLLLSNVIVIVLVICGTSAGELRRKRIFRRALSFVVRQRHHPRRSSNNARNSLSALWVHAMRRSSADNLPPVPATALPPLPPDAASGGNAPSGLLNVLQFEGTNDRGDAESGLGNSNPPNVKERTARGTVLGVTGMLRPPRPMASIMRSSPFAQTKTQAGMLERRDSADLF